MLPGVFHDFLTPLLTHFFFSQRHLLLSSHPSTKVREKYAGHEVLLNRVSNLQPAGHGDTLTTEPLWRDTRILEYIVVSLYRKKESSGSSTSSAISALILKSTRFTCMYISCMSVLRSGKRSIRAFHSFIRTRSGKRSLRAFPSLI